MRWHVHVPAIPRVKRVRRRDIRGSRRLCEWNGGRLLLLLLMCVRRVRVRGCVHLLVRMGMGVWRLRGLWMVWPRLSLGCCCCRRWGLGLRWRLLLLMGQLGRRGVRRCR